VVAADGEREAQVAQAQQAKAQLEEAQPSVMLVLEAAENLPQEQT